MATIPKDINDALPVISEVLIVLNEKHTAGVLEVSFGDLAKMLRTAEGLQTLSTQDLATRTQTAISWLLKENRITVNGDVSKPDAVISILPMPKRKRN